MQIEIFEGGGSGARIEMFGGETSFFPSICPPDILKRNLRLLDQKTGKNVSRAKKLIKKGLRARN